MPLESAIFEDWVFSKCVNNLIFWVSQVDLSSRQVYYWFRETRRGEGGLWQGRVFNLRYEGERQALKHTQNTTS